MSKIVSFVFHKKSYLENEKRTEYTSQVEDMIMNFQDRESSIREKIKGNTGLKVTMQEQISTVKMICEESGRIQSHFLNTPSPPPSFLLSFFFF